jgi:hypothetical protein
MALFSIRSLDSRSLYIISILLSYLIILIELQPKMFTESHIVQLPTSPRPSTAAGDVELSPKNIATQWIHKLEAVLNANEVSQLPNIMHSDSWWRDMLGLTWDFRTLHGFQKISSYISDNQSHAYLHNFKLRSEGNFTPRVVTPVAGVIWIESMFDFESEVGSGSGMVRLLEDENGVWKGCMIYTALQEMKDFKELSGVRRPYGGNNSLTCSTMKENWLERRQRKMKFIDEDPIVLITGAGASIYCRRDLYSSNIIQVKQDSTWAPDCRLLACQFCSSTRMRGLEITGETDTR